MESKIKVVKEAKSFGHMNLNSTDFPEVKNFNLGEPIQVLVTLDIKSLRAPDRWEIASKEANPKDVHAGGDIIKVEFPKKLVKK